jgi:23S rRNA (uracil1939-C5)-methyltransferase
MPAETRTATLNVTRLGAHGDGLASLDGKPVGVAFTLENETVEAAITQEKYGLTAFPTRFISTSKHRVKPPCPHFGPDAVDKNPCGGCVIQHAEDAHYRAWKRGKVRHVLAKAGIAHDCGQLFVTPPLSRRRAVFTAARRGKHITLGFNRRASHMLVDIHSCMVVRPAITALLPSLRAKLETILGDDQQVDVHVTEVNEVLSVMLSGLHLTAAQEQALAAWAIERNIGMLYARSGDEAPRIILKQAQLKVRYGETDVLLPPASFMQASFESEQAMLDFIAPHMDGVKTYADLFCGSGVFALSFAEKATRITAADADEMALSALHYAARDMQKLATVKRNLFSDPFAAHELKDVDAVIIDPPRAGAEAQAKLLAQAKVKKIIYVSCNPVSFARDAQHLVAGGYKLVDLKLFDQFLWSAHIELIGVFTR